MKNTFACCHSGAITCAGGKVGAAALGIAKLCYGTLISNGFKAYVYLRFIRNLIYNDKEQNGA